jgi:hypothetical protein
MLTNETVLTFSEAAAHLPRLHGRKIHASSVWRWARKGVQGIRLETLRLGGRFVTSLEALERFGKALAEIDTPSSNVRHVPAASCSRTENRRVKAVAAARRQLDEARI